MVLVGITIPLAVVTRSVMIDGGLTPEEIMEIIQNLALFVGVLLGGVMFSRTKQFSSFLIVLPIVLVFYFVAVGTANMQEESVRFENKLQEIRSYSNE